MNKKTIKVGDRFDKLVAIKLLKIDKDYHRLWQLQCDCGKKTVVRKSDLFKYKKISCGCYRDSLITTHGMGHTRINNIWSGILTRVKNRKTKYVKYYKNKGISVSKSWLKFENFYKDMGKSYNEHCKKYGVKNTTIDRIDSNKNYCKRNCKWSTYAEQNRNKFSNVKYKGETATEASYRLTNGHNQWLVFSRIKNGWPIEKAFTTPRLK